MTREEHAAILQSSRRLTSKEKEQAYQLLLTAIAKALPTHLRRGDSITEMRDTLVQAMRGQPWAQDKASAASPHYTLAQLVEDALLLLEKNDFFEISPEGNPRAVESHSRFLAASWHFDKKHSGFHLLEGFRTDSQLRKHLPQVMLLIAAGLLVGGSAHDRHQLQRRLQTLFSLAPFEGALDWHIARHRMPFAVVVQGEPVASSDRRIRFSVTGVPNASLDIENVPPFPTVVLATSNRTRSLALIPGMTAIVGSHPPQNTNLHHLETPDGSPAFIASIVFDGNTIQVYAPESSVSVLDETRGQDLVEYALMAGLVGAAGQTIARQFGLSVPSLEWWLAVGGGLTGLAFLARHLLARRRTSATTTRHDSRADALPATEDASDEGQPPAPPPIGAEEAYARLNGREIGDLEIIRWAFAVLDFYGLRNGDHRLSVKLDDINPDIGHLLKGHVSIDLAQQLIDHIFASWLQRNPEMHRLILFLADWEKSGNPNFTIFRNTTPLSPVKPEVASRALLKLQATGRKNLEGICRGGGVYIAPFPDLASSEYLPLLKHVASLTTDINTSPPEFDPSFPESAKHPSPTSPDEWLGNVKGQDLVEYGLMVGVLAVAGLTIFELSVPALGLWMAVAGGVTGMAFLARHHLARRRAAAPVFRGDGNASSGADPSATHSEVFTLPPSPLAEPFGLPSRVVTVRGRRIHVVGVTHGYLFPADFLIVRRLVDSVQNRYWGLYHEENLRHAYLLMNLGQEINDHQAASTATRFLSWVNAIVFWPYDLLEILLPRLRQRGYRLALRSSEYLRHSEVASRDRIMAEIVSEDESDEVVLLLGADHINGVCNWLLQINHSISSTVQNPPLATITVPVPVPENATRSFVGAGPSFSDENYPLTSIIHNTRGQAVIKYAGAVAAVAMATVVILIRAGVWPPIETLIRSPLERMILTPTGLPWGILAMTGGGFVFLAIMVIVGWKIYQAERDNPGFGIGTALAMAVGIPYSIALTIARFLRRSRQRATDVFFAYIDRRNNSRALNRLTTPATLIDEVPPQRHLAAA